MHTNHSVSLQGKQCQLSGDFPQESSLAPNFLLVDKNLTNRSLFKDFSGKKILVTVPSLDTEVCCQSAKQFNSKITKDITLIYISADLPFASARVCGAEHLDNVYTLSMMRDKQFAKDYGVLLMDGPLQGLCARAVFGLDSNNTIVYTELVSEITQEPNYEQVLDKMSQY